MTSEQLKFSVIGKMAECLVAGKRRLVLIKSIINQTGPDYDLCPLEGVKVVWDDGKEGSFVQSKRTGQGSLHFLKLID
jgi:hypothetical protein